MDAYWAKGRMLASAGRPGLGIVIESGDAGKMSPKLNG
jgi:hypothetical protein